MREQTKSLTVAVTVIAFVIILVKRKVKVIFEKKKKCDRHNFLFNSLDAPKKKKSN